MEGVRTAGAEAGGAVGHAATAGQGATTPSAPGPAAGTSSSATHAAGAAATAGAAITAAAAAGAAARTGEAASAAGSLPGGPGITVQTACQTTGKGAGTRRVKDIETQTEKTTSSGSSSGAGVHLKLLHGQGTAAGIRRGSEALPDTGTGTEVLTGTDPSHLQPHSGVSACLTGLTGRAKLTSSSSSNPAAGTGAAAAVAVETVLPGMALAAVAAEERAGTGAAAGAEAGAGAAVTAAAEAGSKASGPGKGGGLPVVAAGVDGLAAGLGPTIHHPRGSTSSRSKTSGEAATDPQQISSSNSGKRTSDGRQAVGTCRNRAPARVSGQCKQRCASH